MVTHSTSACGSSSAAGWTTNEAPEQRDTDVRHLDQQPGGLIRCASRPSPNRWPTRRKRKRSSPGTSTRRLPPAARPSPGIGPREGSGGDYGGLVTTALAADRPPLPAHPSLISLAYQHEPAPSVRVRLFGPDNPFHAMDPYTGDVSRIGERGWTSPAAGSPTTSRKRSPTPPATCSSWTGALPSPYDAASAWAPSWRARPSAASHQAAPLCCASRSRPTDAR